MWITPSAYRAIIIIIYAVTCCYYTAALSCSVATFAYHIINPPFPFSAQPAIRAYLKFFITEQYFGIRSAPLTFHISPNQAAFSAFFKFALIFSPFMICPSNKTRAFIDFFYFPFFHMFTTLILYMQRTSERTL